MATQAGQEILGINGNENVRQTHILRCFADREREKARQQLIPKLREHGRLEFDTLGRNLRTGVEIPLHCSCFMIPDLRTGSPEYLAVIAEDISDRKRAEERLQMFCSVVQFAPDYFGIATIDQVPVFLNLAGQNKFGISGEGQLAQLKGLHFVAEEERERVRKKLIPLLLEKGKLTEEIRARNSTTGDTFDALWTAFVIRDLETGTPRLLAAVVKDITERKLAEQELRRREAELAAIQKEQLSRENISLKEQVQQLREGVPAAEFKEINHHDKPIKPSFLIEVMALECLHPPFGGRFDYEFHGAFSTLADRFFDTWKDPAGLGTPVSDMMTQEKKQAACTALKQAARQATQAIDLVRQGRNGDALRAWRELFGVGCPFKEALQNGTMGAALKSQVDDYAVALAAGITAEAKLLGLSQATELRKSSGSTDYRCMRKLASYFPEMCVEGHLQQWEQRASLEMDEPTIWNAVQVLACEVIENLGYMSGETIMEIVRESGALVMKI